LSRAHWIAAIGVLSAAVFAIDGWITRRLYMLGVALLVVATVVIVRL
jgi:hypothetical protein